MKIPDPKLAKQVERDGRPEDILSPKQLAVLMGASEADVRARMKRGEIPGFKFGEKLWRTRRSEIVAWLNGDADKSTIRDKRHHRGLRRVIAYVSSEEWDLLCRAAESAGRGTTVSAFVIGAALRDARRTLK